MDECKKTVWDVLNSIVININVDEQADCADRKYFEILNEEVVFDKDKYYEIIICSYTDKVLKYSDLDIKYGPILRINKSTSFINKWNDKLTKYQKINQNNPSLYTNEIEEIKEIIKK